VSNSAFNRVLDMAPDKLVRIGTFSEVETLFPDMVTVGSKGNLTMNVVEFCEHLTLPLETADSDKKV
jgi:hypothetical protein